MVCPSISLLERNLLPEIREVIYGKSAKSHNTDGHKFSFGTCKKLQYYHLSSSQCQRRLVKMPWIDMLMKSISVCHLCLQLELLY